MKRILLSLAGLFACLLVVTPAAAQTVEPATIPDPVVGVPYTQTFTTNGFAPILYSVAGTTPPGLTFTSAGATATLSGTPTTAGPYNFTVSSATPFPVPLNASRAYAVTVQPAAAPVPTLSEWAMILFGVVLAGGAALHLSRRRLGA